MSAKNIVGAVSYEPRLGDYGVVSTKGLIGFMIQLGTRSQDNHVIGYVGNGMIIEATPRKGIILSKLSEYDGFDIAWNKNEDLTDEQREIIVTEAAKHLNDPYNFIAIAVIALRILGLHLPSRLTKKIAKMDAYICSEFWTEMYKKAGKAVSLKEDWAVTPSDMAYRLLFM
jgi:hypothetical protein